MYMQCCGGSTAQALSRASLNLGWRTRGIFLGKLLFEQPSLLPCQRSSALSPWPTAASSPRRDLELVGFPVVGQAGGGGAVGSQSQS